MICGNSTRTKAQPPIVGTPHKVRIELTEVDCTAETESMQTALDLKKLYEEDEHLWLFENAKLLREGRLDLADIEHLAETLEELGKRDFREIINRLRVLTVHLLKWIFSRKRDRAAGREPL